MLCLYSPDVELGLSPPDAAHLLHVIEVESGSGSENVAGSEGVRTVLQAV